MPDFSNNKNAHTNDAPKHSGTPKHSGAPEDVIDNIIESLAGASFTPRVPHATRTSFDPAAVAMSIDRDEERFESIIKGQSREKLRKYIREGQIPGKDGGKVVEIPMPELDLPRFIHDPGEGGQGGDGGNGDGEGGSGNPTDKPGQHHIEQVSLDEAAQILGEELGLPNIEQKGKDLLQVEKGRYSSIQRTGPRSLIHFKRSWREALKRQFASGSYNEDDPDVYPVSEDLRYRSQKIIKLPDTNAVAMYAMDVSGSMGREQKEMVRRTTFWIDTWLRSQYDNLETVYIIHDAVAQVVDRKTFFSTREAGGTKISSAYELMARLEQEKYPANEWNLYGFQFSDGDNWSHADNQRCAEIMRQKFLPKFNQFAYGQVKSPYGSGQFKSVLDELARSDERIVTADISDPSAIMPAIKKFLSGGR